MKVRVVIEYDSEVGAYAAYCPELPGCATAGETEEEAFRNIREAIELYLEPTGEAGKGDKTIDVVVHVETRFDKNATDAIRPALRLPEERETPLAALRRALAEGEESGVAGPLDMEKIKRQARKDAGRAPS